jgi:hypothetical protein
MSPTTLVSLRAVGLAALAVLTAAPLARASISDYEFRLVDAQVKIGRPIIAVRLVHKADDKAVTGAVIFAKRLDMAPDDMESMTSAIEPAQSLEPGVYRFKVDLTDEGRWRISLAAKVQGETGTLLGRLVLTAAP